MLNYWIMKERLKKLLKKCPPLYNLAVKIFTVLRNPYLFAERIIGTRAREWEWERRHQHKGNDWRDNQHSGQNDDWVLSYWESQNHPHRVFLLDKIAEFSPVSSILEIGCNCGPNLQLITQRFPGAEICGIDINPVAIKEGRELFAAAGISNVQLSVAKADELKSYPDKNFDVVFSDAVLIYIGPDKIQKTIKEMLRVSRKGLILVERHCFEPDKDPHGTGIRSHDLWQRDYTALLKQYIPQERIQITRVTADMWPDAGWQRNGAFIKVGLSDPAK